ncbi:hypothetical protein ACW9KT_15605 [Hymenobacter sp. HD11105]
MRGYFRRLEDQEEPIRKLASLIANINRAPDHPGYEPEEIWPMRKDPPFVPPVPLTPEEQAEQEARMDAMDADLL